MKPMNKIVRYLRENGPSRRDDLPHDPAHLKGVGKFNVEFEENSHGQHSGHKNRIYFALEEDNMEDVVKKWIQVNKRTLEKREIPPEKILNSTDEVIQIYDLAKLRI